MAELEQLAGRIVLLHQGQIAFDGDFTELRRLLDRAPRADPRDDVRPGRPARPAPSWCAPKPAATNTPSTPPQVKLSELLEQAAAQTEVLDVETHRAPIDDVVADLYEHWLARSPLDKP